MPNFQDYCARAGDVGFIIKLTQLRQQHGGTFSIQGFAESFAAVACTWVEPDTHGLHMAHFWPMAKDQTTLTRMEIKALLATMHGSGWAQSANAAARYALAHQDEPAAEVLLGLNWADRYWLHGPGPSDELTRHLSESWISTLPQLTTSRFTAASFVKEVLHSVPCPPSGPSLLKVCEDIRRMIRQDLEAVKLLKGLPVRKDTEFRRKELDGISEDLWKKLLSQVRISCVLHMAVLLPTVRVELCLINADAVSDCFPWYDVAGDRQEVFQGAALGNEGNVFFLSKLEDVQVTADSAADAMKQLSWMLNRHRLAVVQRGRAAGRGSLSVLEDNVFWLVSDFVSPNPNSRR